MAIECTIKGEVIIEIDILDSAKDRYPTEASIVAGLEGGTLDTDYTYTDNAVQHVYIVDDNVDQMHDWEKVATIKSQYIEGCFSDWKEVKDGLF